MKYNACEVIKPFCFLHKYNAEQENILGFLFRKDKTVLITKRLKLGYNERMLNNGKQKMPLLRGGK